MGLPLKTTPKFNYVVILTCGKHKFCTEFFQSSQKLRVYKLYHFVQQYIPTFQRWRGMQFRQEAEQKSLQAGAKNIPSVQ